VIESTPEPDPDNLVKIITILDKTIVIERYGTVFHPYSTSVPFDYDSIAQDNYVKLSGYTNNDGTILATHIEDLGPFNCGNSVVAIKGIVENYQWNDRFNIGSNIILIKADTQFPCILEGWVRNGIRVKVEGIQGCANTIDADEIEIIEDDEPINELVNGDFIPSISFMEGIVNDLQLNDRTFILDGIIVDFSAIDYPLPGFELDNDQRVEVAGEVVNNIMVAELIRARSGEIKVSGRVTRNDYLINKSITVEVREGNPILVHLDLRTLFEDEMAEDDTVVLPTSIKEGDFVKVKSMLDIDGTSVIANSVKIDEPEDSPTYKLRSYVTSFDPLSHEITLLNTTFSTSVDTDFEDMDDVDLASQEEFYSLIQVGDLVTIEDDRDQGNLSLYGDGLAEEVEIEYRDGFISEEDPDE
jgi:hypothetical protein